MGLAWPYLFKIYLQVQALACPARAGICCLCLLGALVRMTFVGYRSNLLTSRSNQGVAEEGLLHTQPVSYAFSADSLKPQKS